MSISKEVGASPQRAVRAEVARLSPAAAIARRHDPDRFLFALFAPPDRREHVFTLIAINHELARALDIAAAGRDYAAMGGHFRLQFWRDLVQSRAGTHELAPALAALLDDGTVTQADLLPLIDARAAELDGPGPTTWPETLRAGPGLLARLTAQLLQIPAHHLDPVQDAGTAYAIGKILRHRPSLRAANRHPVPDDLPDATLLAEARPRLAAATHLRLPRAQRAALLPATLARRDLARAAAARPQDHPRGLLDRLAVLTAALSGRP